MAENLPARGLFSGSGFGQTADDLWEIRAEEATALPALGAHYKVEIEDLWIPEA